MINRTGFFAFLLFAAFQFSSCEQERDPCLQPLTAYVRIHAVRSLSDSTVADTLLPHPRWMAIDSQKIVLFGEKTSKFSLSLNPAADSSRYVLQPDSATLRFDTLVFYHARKLQFLSNACGYTYFYTLLNVTSTLHNIDSVRLRNDEVNGNVNTPEHVQIYF